MMLVKKDKCSKGTQYCETSDALSSTSIVLAVVIPVAVVAMVVAFFIWRAWKRNKKEALDDNDPDFYGDNTVLPDYPTKEEIFSGRNTSENPFDASNTRYPQAVLDEKDQSFSNKAGSYYNASQLSLGTDNMLGTPRGHMESFVLPRVDDSTSKHSLDQLSRQLGGVYPGYKVPENVRFSSNNHSRKSLFSENSGDLTGFERSTEDLGRTLGPQNSDKSPETLQKSSTVYSQPDNTFSPPTSGPPGDQEESDDDKFYETTDPGHRVSYDAADSHKYSFDDTDASVVQRHSRDLDAIVQPQNIEPDHENRDEFASDSVSKEAPVDEYSEVPENSHVSSSPVGKALPEPEAEEVPDLNEVLVEEHIPISPEEEEQINRMKSVYKVYFSRENSLKSKKSNHMFFEDQDMPPLPHLPQNEEHDIPRQPEYTMDPSQEDEVSAQQQDEKENIDHSVSNGRPELTLDTSVNDHRASYASSIYLDNGAVPVQQQGHPFYPHQHIQNILNQQQSQAHYYRQMAAQQRKPQHYPVEQKLENLPSPHELNNRNSTLETFTQFEKQRKYTGKKGQSPVVMQQNFSPIENTQWGPSQTNSSHPSPHQIRDSIVMFNPVDINYKKTYKPSGTLAEQVRKVSPGARSFSPTSPGFAYDDDPTMPRPMTRVGSESLIPKSGSQADLRKYVDNANL
ncbi:hypothetical protein KL935_001400 [Ogataea polymorpha]|uniref:Uncharacterized protein n=1 Tax=Ogataea polymorpha TaxID=460523 RepID=A0A1B7SIS7_9ASCO|nr:uncharacterized protein OGAPODRAFT_93394 [Ogataea polymorpha]KAG7882243.1 hypothetical protein KL937_000814 [Ogataea polymorpha]KAG7895025.1 hypothetical protein KL908_001375 [Ogataea polymorpha]KAG7902492.1 hypothetical protein KL935_001400 [Ogataea polymorpha]KAG7911520.1 hypothetical protein KL906_000841 [Ogataea polymorpha]KAG7919261.1 hypothetical protein KL927_001390 [Ogataea polymorpha]